MKLNIKLPDEFFSEIYTSHDEITKLFEDEIKLCGPSEDIIDIRSKDFLFTYIFGKIYKHRESFSNVLEHVFATYKQEVNFQSGVAGTIWDFMYSDTLELMEKTLPYQYVIDIAEWLCDDFCDNLNMMEYEKAIPGDDGMGLIVTHEYEEEFNRLQDDFFQETLNLFLSLVYEPEIHV